MSSYIYIIGPTDPPIKIGISKDYDQRIKSLQTGHSQKLILHHVESVSDDIARVLEQIIHKNLNLKKTHGEWFNISIEDAILEIKWAIIRYEDEINLKQKFKNRMLIN